MEYFARPLVPEDNDRAASAAMRASVADFIKLAQITALQREGGTPDLEIQRASDRVKRMLVTTKAPVTPMDSSSDVTGDRAVVGRAFASSLIGTAVFDTLLANGMRRVPLRSRGVVISTAPTGSLVAEGSAKPISEMELSGETLDPQKVWAAVAATRELLDFSRPGARELFESELRRAVVRAVDSLFLSQLYAATTPISSAGPSFANVLVDIGAALAQVDIRAGSRVVLVISPALARTWITMLTTGNNFAFPRLTVNGGMLVGGIEVMVSDALPTSGSPATPAAILIVSDGVIGNADAPTVRQIRDGDIVINSAPDSPATAATLLRSMWQSNLAALGVERFVAFEVATRSVASLSY
jgi:hypothetical protein